MTDEEVRGRRVFGRSFIMKNYEPLTSAEHDDELLDSFDLFNLILNTTATTETEEESSRSIQALVDTLRTSIGEHNTIWGVKVPATAGEIALEYELYWCNDGDATRSVRPTEIARLMRPWVDWNASGCDLDTIDELVRRGIVSMFSVDIPAGSQMPVSAQKINVYFDDKALTHRGGADFICQSYACDATGIHLANTYVSYELEHESAIASRAMASPNYPYLASESYIMCALFRWPQMTSAPPRPFWIVHATKTSGRDGLYFAGASVNNFLQFLKSGPDGGCEESLAALYEESDDAKPRDVCEADECDEAGSPWHWPLAFVRALEVDRTRFEALRVDIGVDYASNARRDRVAFQRTALFGTL